jgi:endonuclease/exonuclease/phosphatase (EEP) superfamily protein YafD
MALTQPTTTTGHASRGPVSRDARPVRQSPRSGVVLACARFGLGGVVAAYLLGLAATLTSIVLGSSQDGWPALLREMILLLLAPLFPLLAAAVLLRARAAMLGLLGPIILLLWLIGPQMIPNVPTAAASGPHFRVLSLNTGAALRLADPDAIVRTVLATMPDVVCLVEAHGNTLTTVGAPLRDEYPYQHGSGEIFVLSRFPLSDERPALMRTGAKDSLHLTVEIDHRLIGLTVVHLQRPDAMPRLRSGARTLYRSGQQFTTGARDAAISELVQYLRAEGGPQIVAGDFNMTPTSAAYQVLSAELRDAFIEGGWGLGHSFPARPSVAGWGVPVPLIRIDYVFHSADLVTVQARVGPHVSSDHLPVLADLALR